MKPIKNLLAFGFCVCWLPSNIYAQQPTNTAQGLDAKQQRIVAVSAFTAKGDLVPLQKALNDGLDVGLTVNEIKEVLVQLYAYAGFPRSLNALNAFIAVLKERKGRGINDPPGKEPGPVAADKTKLQRGTAIQTRLVGEPVKGEVYDFAPVIDRFLKEHLFSDIFGRDNLDWKTREVATISALAALGAAGNQLRSHFGVGLYNGLTGAQLRQLVSIIRFNVSATEGAAASEILETVLLQKKGAEAPEKAAVNDRPARAKDEKKSRRISAGRQASVALPKGEKITNDHFIGNAWLDQMVAPDSVNATQVGSVTFAPGARTKWHLHPGGQILVITDGTGYYQEKGSRKRIVHKGDVIKCPPNVAHWHGAGKNEKLIQLAITNTQKGTTVWLETVTDEEYLQ